MTLQEEQIVLRSFKCELRKPGQRGGSVISLLRRQMNGADIIVRVPVLRDAG